MVDGCFTFWLRKAGEPIYICMKCHTKIVFYTYLGEIIDVLSSSSRIFEA